MTINHMLTTRDNVKLRLSGSSWVKISQMGQKWAGLVVSREASQDKDIDQQFVAKHIIDKHKSQLVSVFNSKI